MADDTDRKAFESMQYATTDKTAVDLMGNKAEVTKEDVHDMLMVAGMTPAIGNIADAADALLYTMEGEFGSAALSLAAMIPFIGQAVSAKKALKIAKESGEEMDTVYRGVKKWYKGTMVKKGKFVGGDDYMDPRYKESLWTTKHKDYAERIASEEGGVLLEFEVPKSYMDKNFITTKFSGKDTGVFNKGLPKEFLKKVHK